MEYRRHSLEQKIKFLDALEKTKSISEASLRAGVPRPACKHWLVEEARIRSDYERSLLPVTCEDHQDYRVVRKISLEDKVKCIRAIDAGMTAHVASAQFNFHASTIRAWYNSREALLALYYAQDNSDDEQSGNSLTQEAPLTVVLEAQMAKDQIDKEFAKKCKAQTREIDYLKDKISFLENLNSILKERTGPVKKKIVLQQSRDASGEKEGT